MDEDTRDRLIRYLDDAWAVEKALVSTLRDMADEVNDAQVRDCFLQHSDETHQQEESLEARIRAMGEEPSGSKGFFNQLMGTLGDIMHAAHDPYDKTTQDLVKGYATENFEIAMYEALSAFAESVGDTETAQLARTIQQQEQAAAQKVWALIRPTATSAVQPVERAA